MKEKSFLEVGEDWEKDVTEVEFFFEMKKYARDAMKYLWRFFSPACV